MHGRTEGQYAVNDFILFKDLDGKYLTLPEALQINKEAEVISVDGSKIENLYAAGEFTGGVHGGNRLGGNAVADFVVFGRIAGANAAANASK